ncbi:twin-arginine translocation protein TatA [Dehalogenimonas sp. WBC-2]|nr:twin-arginine translocation protein TatA [Dehalogenimonas sp. WBC-2]
MRIGPTEIIIVLVIVVLIFGIGKLPELGKSLGEGLRSFRKAQDTVDQEVKSVTSAVSGKPAPKSTPAVTDTDKAPDCAVVQPPSNDED